MYITALTVMSRSPKPNALHHVQVRLLLRVRTLAKDLSSAASFEEVI